MAKFRLEILTPAWNELEGIACYHLHVVGPDSARKITDSILNALERLREFPLSCPYVPDSELKAGDYRMLVCDQYVCIYRLIEKVVYVYHIAHGVTDYSKLFKVGR
ncbi:MAG: type II toxin-antitoxin system RelE/ParE family toxin [Syntrophomonadaceae bacterium]|nr:type II toxin-antitoxin system RelE/ParE family toxin [Syntrophomonadaceae bacterium]